MGSVGPTATHTPTRWGAVALVVGAGIVTAFQAGKAAIAIPSLQASLGLDLATAGWLSGIFAVLGVVGSIPCGALVARIGDRPLLIAGLASALSGATAGALAPGYGLLLGSRVLEGLGFLLITVSGPAILNRVARPERRELAFSLWSCFMPAGMALAMAAGPQFSDWRGLWWASGAAAAAMLAAMRLVPPARYIAPPATTTPRRAAAVLVARAPVLLAVCFAFYSLMFFALFSFLPVLLMARMGIRHDGAGLHTALAAGVNIIGNLAAGYLLARGTSRFAILAFALAVMGLAAPGIFLPIFSASQALLLCMLFSAVGGLIPATLISSAPMLAGPAHPVPVVLGLLMQGSALGQMLGPPLVGSAIHSFGWTSAAWIVVCSALGAMGAASLVRPAIAGRQFQ